MKLLVLEVDDNNSAYNPMAHPNFWASAILSVRELPTALELGEVAIMAWYEPDGKEIFGVEDGEAFKEVGQAILDALTKGKP